MGKGWGWERVIFFFLCAAPGFNQFLVADFAPVFKGLVLALELLVSKASSPVVAGFRFVFMSRSKGWPEVTPFMCLHASCSLTGVSLTFICRLYCFRVLWFGACFSFWLSDGQPL